MRRTATHGRRYTPAQKQGAYLVWRIAAGRSIAKTAELTAGSEGTIAAWHAGGRIGDDRAG